jgi:hypothetical protein
LIPESIAILTTADASSGVAFITTIPPKPIVESISPVIPSDLFSILPDDIFLLMADRSDGNKLIAGTAIAVFLINSRLFIGSLLRLYTGNKDKR